MHFQVVEEGWRLKKVGWDTGHRKKPVQWGLYRRSVNKLISYEQTVYDQSGLGFKYLMPEWGFRHLCLLNQFLVQFITNTGNTIKIKTVSGDELYFYSPQESELLNYVQVCSYKHLSESLISSDCCWVCVASTGLLITMICSLWHLGIFSIKETIV